MPSMQVQPTTFQGLQRQGMARPPSAARYAAAESVDYAQPGGWGSMPGAGGGQAPGSGSTPGQGQPRPPAPAPPPPGYPPGYKGPQVDQSHPGGPPVTVPRPPQPAPPPNNQPPPYQQAPNNPQQNGPQPSMPNVQSMWERMFSGAGFQGGPQSNYSPSGYQGPGTLNAHHDANYQGPQVQGQGTFTAPQGGQQVDQRTQQSVLQALGMPSRYGAPEVGAAFDVLNHRLTQQGNADKQTIDADMASRGLFSSTTAGGKLGDLATNLNQQRADFATNLATDQARNYESDRAQAISQAMGYGGQQFGQGLETFGANQNAGQQRFLQEQAAGEFGLSQNNQNFNQEATQHGINQQEGLNKFNSGLDTAQFRLNQNNQNFNQGAQANQQTYNQRTGALVGLQNFGQQGYQNQLDTSRFNSDQDYRNNQLLLQSLGYL